MRSTVKYNHHNLSNSNLSELSLTWSSSLIFFAREAHKRCSALFWHQNPETINQLLARNRGSALQELLPYPSGSVLKYAWPVEHVFASGLLASLALRSPTCFGHFLAENTKQAYLVRTGDTMSESRDAGRRGRLVTGVVQT